MSRAEPGEIKPPPASSGAKRVLREAEERSRAIPVYRALVRAAPGIMTYAEIVREAGLFNLQEAIDAVVWMRAHGIDIVVLPGREPGEPAGIALKQRIPEAFEPLG